MAAPIKCMIKCNVENKKSRLRALKIKQRKLNEMKTWICRQGIILFVPMHSLCQCFPVIFSNHLASILQPYPLPYSEPWQKSKMESFSRIVMGKFPLKSYSFLMIAGDGGSAEVNSFAQNHFILEVPSNWLVHTFSIQCDQILILAAICLSSVFRYKTFKYQFQFRIQHLQIG